MVPSAYSFLPSLLVVALVFGSLNCFVSAFNNSRSDNIAAYWGQDAAGSQQSLSHYCQDDLINAIPMAFLNIFSDEGGYPVIDFSNICGSWNGRTFSGTNLADCSQLEQDIRFCQKKGKIVTLSLGGADAKVGFSSDDKAVQFGQLLWDMFLGGQGPIRPLGQVALDGIDLDIEQGTPNHYATMINTIKELAKGSKKRYYFTAAPQCPFPDAYIGTALNDAPFDAVYVQFYNNYCETSKPAEFNFGTWDHWANTRSANRNIKVYIGAPGSPKSAGSGYVDAKTLADVAKATQDKYSSFGGMMFWDANSVSTNGNFLRTIREALTPGDGNAAPDPGPNPNPAHIPPLPPHSHPVWFGPWAAATNSKGNVDPDPTQTPADPRATARVERPSLTVTAREGKSEESRPLKRSRYFRL